MGLILEYKSQVRLTLNGTATSSIVDHYDMKLLYVQAVILFGVMALSQQVVGLMIRYLDPS